MRYDFSMHFPREVLKPESERLRFQHHPRDPADVNVSEKQV